MMVIKVYVVATHGQAYQMSTLCVGCDTLQAPPSMIFFFCFSFATAVEQVRLQCRKPSCHSSRVRRAETAPNVHVDVCKRCLLGCRLLQMGRVLG